MGKFTSKICRSELSYFFTVWLVSVRPGRCLCLLLKDQNNLHHISKMLHQMSQVTLVLLVAVLISATLTSAGSIRPVVGRDEITECDTILRVSHVCYQCSKVHEEEFNTVYKSCCTGVPSMREYCNFIYTEPPKRGGLWM